MNRGIQATATGVERSKSALKLKGWTQEYLAGVAGCTRQTLSQFLKGNRIEKRIFQEICNALDLKWGDIAELEAEEQKDRSPTVDEVVETIRINIYDSIQAKCGSMRVLDMSQPIDLNAIYTNVNILEKITGRQRLDYRELLQSFSLENFDRLTLSRVKEAHIPALDAVDKYAKLMILGKPGSGKTTFLKYVALQCIEKKFKPRLIPLFITLKDFAETDNQKSLSDYIVRFHRVYGVELEEETNNKSWKKYLSYSDTSVEFLLQQGRFLILLDGLDEVRESDSKRVVQQIHDLSNRFSNNLFVITCRIAAREYTFERFTEVEVADFNEQQIDTFTQQWFQSKNDHIKAKNFIEKLKQEPGIRDLASSPLLLTLLCLVFGESASFPSNRSELYKEGLDVLLKKWDAKRNIERDILYKNLSLKRKEDLLSQIALDTFEKGKYFFKQLEAEGYITQYIRNLPDANTEEETLQMDSEAVLKSIEAQHGLFVERARGIYSFSHLTFHEYFTARKIVTSANSDVSIQKVAKYVTDKRWREVLLLTIGMLENADLLVLTMKREIDSILSGDEELQKFLDWVDRKSCSTTSNYKPTAIRAYYFDIARARVLDLPLSLDLSLSPAIDLARAFDIDRARAIPRALPLARELARQLPRVLPLARELASTLDLVFDLDLSLALDHNLYLELDRDRALALAHMLDLPLPRALARARTLALDLSRALALDLALDIPLDNAVAYIQFDMSRKQSRTQLPNISLENRRNFYFWWQINGQEWTEKLRKIAIEDRNIGHDWQFSEAQKKLLQQYYDANQLLVDCLNSDCYVSREVREEIESTLLLPIESIEKWRSKGC